jgi:hypothetical protein
VVGKSAVLVGRILDEVGKASDRLRMSKKTKFLSRSKRSMIKEKK